ncbi:MAG: 1-(5-phosphoribosyl)-5-[(5-phosphoribosylamino)methylideneamino] imidazole-4-carboxamide isomerase, partial [Synergistaceae bacterium]|nr:1-(5-phosphoribosyl)-5-[(5-phosphoribosylamino)methylideneamino] imidazole-4-carboxamide isomerase [Synergistaceae bacterium]
LIERLRIIGFRLFLITAVHKDGTESGPDVELYRGLKADYPDIEIIAAGGVSSIDDLRVLKNAGLSGVVLGKTLYEGRISLSSALEEARL